MKKSKKIAKGMPSAVVLSIVIHAGKEKRGQPVNFRIRLFSFNHSADAWS